jgi:hypothetical protein
MSITFLKLTPLLLLINLTFESIINFELEYPKSNLIDSITTSKYILNGTIENYQFPKKLNYSSESASDYSIAQNEAFQLIFQEDNGIKINNFEFTKDDRPLTLGWDYKITPTINEEVLPYDYFDNSTTNCQNCNYSLSCNYVNPGPKYSYGVFKNFEVDRYVSFKNYNFGINGTIPGIQVITLKNFTLETASLDTFLKDHGHDDISTDNVTFKNIYSSTPQFEANDYLIGQSYNKSLYIYKIFDDTAVDDGFKIEYYSICNLSLFNFTSFNQVDVYNDKLIIGGDEGFIVANKTDDTWKVVFVNRGIKVKDFITNKKTVYIIEKDFGMRIFDIVNLKFTQYEFQHPGMTKFDWNLDQVTGFYYVGIIINNNPPAINEVLIELIVDQDEFNPSLNKVFTSSHKYSASNIVTDQFYGLTYIFDSASYNIYIIQRFIVDTHNLYSFRLNLKDYLLKTFGQIAPTHPVYLISDFNIQNKMQILVQNYENYLVLRDIRIPLSQLTCSFNETGQFSMSYTSEVCLDLKAQGREYISNCNVNNIWNIEVTEENKSMLWGVLAFIIILIALILIGIVCVRTGCLRSRKGNKNYNSQYCEAGVIEVNVDNLKT